MTDRTLLSPREHLLEAQRLLSEASYRRSENDPTPLLRVGGALEHATNPRAQYVHNQLVERAKAHAMIAHAIAALESRPC